MFFIESKNLGQMLFRNLSQVLFSTNKKHFNDLAAFRILFIRLYFLQR